MKWWIFPSTTPPPQDPHSAAFPLSKKSKKKFPYNCSKYDLVNSTQRLFILASSPTVIAFCKSISFRTKSIAGRTTLNSSTIPTPDKDWGVTVPPTRQRWGVFLLSTSFYFVTVQRRPNWVPYTWPKFNRSFCSTKGNNTITECWVLSFIASRSTWYNQVWRFPIQVFENQGPTSGARGEEGTC